MRAGRIVFLSKGPDSASTRYRALNYFERLRGDGFEPSHYTIGTGVVALLPLLRVLRRAAVVVVLRRTLDPLSARLLRAVSRRLVFDLDDAIFVRSNGMPSRQREHAFARMARLSDSVWAGNAYLADAARAHTPRVETLPTCLDAERYRPSPFDDTGHQELAWIGSRATRKYLEPLLPSLECLAETRPGLRLNVISNFVIDSHRLNIRCIPWSPQSEVEALAQSHIGLAPTPDNAWTRGKCAFKILQYMAAGLPVVASPVGANGEIVLPGVTGFLATDDSAWRTALSTLLDDGRAMRRMGAAGRACVMAHFTLEQNHARLRQSLEALS